MYVCVCRAVTERQIGVAVHGGARSLKDLKHKLDVGRLWSMRALCPHLYRGGAPRSGQTGKWSAQSGLNS